jgi:hypothetical protein
MECGSISIWTGRWRAGVEEVGDVADEQIRRRALTHSLIDLCPMTELTYCSPAVNYPVKFPFPELSVQSAQKSS